MKLWESQTLVWPQARKTLSTKTAKFWYIHYILRFEKDQELKIVEAEDKILIYTMSEIQPLIRYILRLEKAQELQIPGAEYKILMYTVSKL